MKASGLLKALPLGPGSSGAHVEGSELHFTGPKVDGWPLVEPCFVHWKDVALVTSDTHLGFPGWQRQHMEEGQVLEGVPCEIQVA